MEHPSEARAETAIDIAAYWLAIVGLYVMEGALWNYSFKEKVFDDDLIAPEPIKKQFDGSFIDSFPGTSVAWGILGILEGVIGLVLLISLIRGELRAKRSCLRALDWYSRKGGVGGPGEAAPPGPERKRTPIVPHLAEFRWHAGGAAINHIHPLLLRMESRGAASDSDHLAPPAR